MDPKDQPQFNPKIPISEVLKQEQSGYVSSAQINQTPENKIAAPGSGQTRIIKTYRSDAAEAIKMQEQASVAKIAMAQEQQRRKQGEEIGATPKKKIGLLLAVIVLIIIGATAIPTVQYILNQKKQEVPVNVEKTIIPFDYQKNIVLNNATRDEFVKVLDTLNLKQPTNSKTQYIKILENIQDANKNTLTQKVAPEIFARLIGPNMPSSLTRSFDSDYMYGAEDSNDPKMFILLKTSAYQQTFAGMLSWETRMLSDLGPILNLGTEATSYPFTDHVIINKDVRAIAAQDGTIVLLYGFLDNQTLIITTDSQTFQSINSRYVAARFVQ